MSDRVRVVRGTVYAHRLKYLPYGRIRRKIILHPAGENRVGKKAVQISRACFADYYFKRLECVVIASTRRLIDAKTRFPDKRSEFRVANDSAAVFFGNWVLFFAAPTFSKRVSRETPFIRAGGRRDDGASKSYLFRNELSARVM